MRGRSGSERAASRFPVPKIPFPRARHCPLMNSFDALFLDPPPAAPEKPPQDRHIETGSLDWPARLKAQEIRNVADEIVSRGESPTLGKIVALLERRDISVSAVDVANVLEQMGVRPPEVRTKLPVARSPQQQVVSADEPLMIDDLLAIKALAEEVGGVEHAEFLIRLLQQLA